MSSVSNLPQVTKNISLKTIIASNETFSSLIIWNIVSSQGMHITPSLICYYKKRILSFCELILVPIKV